MVDISICNQALALSGARSKITSLTEDRPEAHACNIYYETTRVELLTAVPWPFARRSLALSLLDGTAEYGWDYTYMYPSDCLTPIMIQPTAVVLSDIRTNINPIRDAQDNQIDFVEGNKVDSYGNIKRVISTNKATAVLVYIADVTNSGIFPPDFRALFVQTLSAKLGQALVGNIKASELQLTIAQNMLAQAINTHQSEYDKDRQPVMIDDLPTGLAARE